MEVSVFASLRCCMLALCLFCTSVLHGRAEDFVVLNTYTCADFLRDTKQPADGVRLLRSLMMISWAAGYAAAHQKGAPRADPAAVQLISAILGDRCRKSPATLTVAAISEAIAELSGAPTASVAKESTAAQIPSKSDLHQKTASFLAELYNAESGSIPEFIELMKNAYADSVQYFGENLSRNDVLVQVTRYVQRWPQRKFIPKTNSTVIQCDESAMTCSAKGVLDFETSSPARNERSTGTATFEFDLSYAASMTPKITRETGTTLERKLRQLVETTAKPSRSKTP